MCTIIDLRVLQLANTDWYLSHFEARVIFRGPSAKSHDICQFSARANVVFGCSVSTMKWQQTMLSCLSSNKRSRRVARNLYKNFSGKQNKGYVLAMEKQPIQIIALPALLLPAV